MVYCVNNIGWPMSKDTPKDPGAAERAARLREEIERLTEQNRTGKPADRPPASGEDKPRPKSPRDFIHDRMRELDKKGST